MSKQLSFRARALDTSKPMPVFKGDDIPELPDFAAINRAVPQMPTGMEKEEETEHHLQRALSAQQVYGTAEKLVIPIPGVDQVMAQYSTLYKINSEYKPPKQFIHVQPWGMDQEIPDYDMDSEDETWFHKQSKNFKNLSLSPLKFENMMDRLEKGSGQTVVTLHEAKALLKEDDDLTIAVYDYWLNKRLRLEHALIPQVKTEKRDGSTTNNPYVAFRRRTEKMQTRKNRKNDESSYERMLKLKRDLNKALTILELMKRREKSKKELLKLTIEIVEKRYQMSDWDSKALAEALAQRHKLPSLIPLQNQYLNRDWGHKDDVGYVKKKREYKKRKHKHVSSQPATVGPRPQLPHYTEVLPTEPTFSSEEEGISPPLSASEHEVEDDPDGVFAFRRKEGCCYHAPIRDGLGDWPWCSRENGGTAEKRFKYSLASIEQPRRCVGFARRRVGRGGRMLLDRAFTEWDDYLSELDLTSTSDGTGWVKDYTNHIRRSGVKHFRPESPTEDSPSFGGWGRFGGSDINPAFRDSLSPPMSMEFNVESFEDHQEQLLQMQRQQQEQLLKQETDTDNSNGLFCLDHSLSSQPNSRFTLDSAKAQFAASAVCNSTQGLPTVGLPTSALPTSGLPTSGLPTSGLPTSGLPTSGLTTSGLTTSGLTTSGLTTSGHTSTEPAAVITSVPTIVSCSNNKSSHASLPVHSPALTALMTRNVTFSQPSSLSLGAKGTAVSNGTSLANGPINSKTCGLSTSPAANILQLNYPLTPRPVTTTVASVTLVTTAPSISLVSTNNQHKTLSSVSTVTIATPSPQLATIASPTFSLSQTTLLSPFNKSTLTSAKTLGTLSVSIPNRVNPGKSPLTIGATRAVTTAVPTILKLATTPSVKNDNIPSRENHDGVNNIAKDTKIVAMEVT